MAFDEVSLPLRVRYGASGGPQFQTEIVSVQGGFERRNQLWAQARRQYDARTGVTSAAEASVLLSFFMARRGRARGFRLRDWADFTSALDGRCLPTPTDQRIGVGDGTQTAFQLLKTYGSGETAYERVIRKPVADSVRIAVDGAEYLSGWSVDPATGLVTFAQAPAQGAVVSAGFLFDVPVRFDTDRIDLTSEGKDAARAEIPLIEVRV